MTGRIAGEVRAEVRKLFGLRTAWVGLIVGLIVAPLLVLVNAPATRRAVADGLYGDVSDLAFESLGIGLLGAMILGVVVVSSEYTPTGEHSPGGRQLTTTLTAMPRRHRLLVAKGIALTLVVAVQGVATATATLLLVEFEHGDVIPAPDPWRAAGAVLYWVLLGLLSYALTLIFRNGIVTLTLLIVNSSVVSVSWLLTKVTPAAAYLPDIVGTHLFLRSVSEIRIAPVPAGLVMTAWVAALLVLAGWLFDRRAV